MSSNSMKREHQRYGDLEIDDDDEVDRIVYDYHHKLTKKKEADLQPNSNAGTQLNTPNPGYLLNPYGIRDRIALESKTPSPSMSTAPTDPRLTSLQDVADSTAWMEPGGAMASSSSYLPIWSSKILQVLPQHLSYAGDVLTALREVETTATIGGMLRNPKIPLIPDSSFDFTNMAGNKGIDGRFQNAGLSHGYYIRKPAPSPSKSTPLPSTSKANQGKPVYTRRNPKGQDINILPDVPVSPSGVKTSRPSRIPAATKRTASAFATPRSGDHESQVFHTTAPSTDLHDNEKTLKDPTIGQSDSSPDSALENDVPAILGEYTESKPRPSEISQPITRPIDIVMRRVVPCTSNATTTATSSTIVATSASNSEDEEDGKIESDNTRRLEDLKKFVKGMDQITEQLRALLKSKN